MAADKSAQTNASIAAKSTSNPTKAAKPRERITFFDAWNSSSTGHQRAENRLSGSTSWRDSRTAKLAQQLKDGQRGGKRMYDEVGAGSEHYGLDGRLENGTWERGASGLRTDGQLSVLEAFGGKVKVTKPNSQPSSQEDKEGSGKKLSLIRSETPETITNAGNAEPETPPKLPREKQIFRDLVIYINGSTFPLISDHKLKKLLAEHGARVSIALGRRTVTHVIIGTPSGKAGGAGGGLAGGKIQKEIANIRGKGVKFVSVEWVLESLKAGKRLPEAGFACLKLAQSGQKSVLGNFGKP